MGIIYVLAKSTNHLQLKSERRWAAAASYQALHSSQQCTAVCSACFRSILWRGHLSIISVIKGSKYVSSITSTLLNKLTCCFKKKLNSGPALVHYKIDFKAQLFRKLCMPCIPGTSVRRWHTLKRCSETHRRKQSEKQFLLHFREYLCLACSFQSRIPIKYHLCQAKLEIWHLLL